MKVTENVYMLDCTATSHAYMVVDGGVTLIDTCVPGLAAKITDELKGYGIQPNQIKQILLTHHDIDHMGNAAELSRVCGCPVYVSAEDMDCVRGVQKRDGIKRLLGLFMKAETPQDLRALPKGNALGIEVISAPGHTRGHTAYRYRDVLFVGDLVAEKGGVITPAPGIMTLDSAENMRSCRGLSTEGVSWICPAHGNPVPVSGWHTFLGA